MTQCLHRSQEIWPYTTLKEVSKTIQDRSGPSICDLKTDNKEQISASVDTLFGSLDHCRYSPIIADHLPLLVFCSGHQVATA